MPDRFVLGLLGWMLEGLDETGTARALDGLRATTAAHMTADGVLYESGAWIIRATRPRPGRGRGERRGRR